jgi:hypothetical protein
VQDAAVAGQAGYARGTGDLRQNGRFVLTIKQVAAEDEQSQGNS